jgi:processive 1,2-diacylglycerol beta-glucosyltransferase
MLKRGWDGWLPGLFTGPSAPPARRIHRSGSGRRILILSASAGTGHVRAAEALERVCREDPRVSEVVHVDALHYTNKLFRDFYSKFYLQLVQNAPNFLGWWYDTSDEPWKTDRMRFMLDRLNTGPLIRLIRKFEPDATLCTHFLPAEIISYLIASEAIRAKLSIVVTDFDCHAMWLSRVFHHYFVALEETREHLAMLGLPRERITVSGIPIDPVFSMPKDRDGIRRKYGLDPGRPLLLISAGAMSVGPAEQVVRVLRHLQTPAQVVVICGRNADLKTRVEARIADTPAPHLHFRALGYTTEMDEWMAAADLFVGKPGGLTTAEALARRLPMVIFEPIPGQEERNSDHLLEQGVAIKCNEISTMPYKIDRLLADPERMARMRAAAGVLARPDAARTVVGTLLNEFHLQPVEVSEESQERMAGPARKR